MHIAGAGTVALDLLKRQDGLAMLVVGERAVRARGCGGVAQQPLFGFLVVVQALKQRGEPNTGVF